MRAIPTFKEERAFAQAGFLRIAGVDEAGCGALAGPVVAGAVILPLNSRIVDLRDSKLLSAKKRDELFDVIRMKATAFGIGIAHVEEITAFGIRPATMLAMRRALEQIAEVDAALVDAWTIPELTITQKGIIRGDKKVKSIAAASVLAKVTRDRMMAEIGKMYPHYGFDIHKGYGTLSHRTAIRNHGPCPAHRMTFTLV